MKREWIILAVALLLLTGCRPDPRREAEAYATRAEADRATALNDQQALAEANKEAQREWQRTYVNGLFESTRPYIIGLFIVEITSFGLIGLLMVWDTRLAYQKFVDIRSGILPEMPSGARPALIMQENRPALPFTRAQHLTNNKYILIDTATGERAYIDDIHQPTLPKLEVYRQIILNAKTGQIQAKSGVVSPHGEVAEAIGAAHVELPGPSVIDLKALPAEFLQDVLKGHGEQ